MWADLEKLNVYDILEKCYHPHDDDDDDKKKVIIITTTIIIIIIMTLTLTLTR